jgi:hypothetical protein
MAVTPEMVGSFIKVFNSEANLSGDLKYSIQLMIPKTDKKGIAQLEALVAKAKTKGQEKKWGGKVPPFRYKPLRDGDEELESGEKTDPCYKGMLFINASCNGNESDPRPQVVGPDAKPLMDQSLLYSGCIVRADLTAFPYKNGGNCGVGWWLNSIMLVRDGDRLDGKVNAADAFANFAVDGETEADDSLA